MIYNQDVELHKGKKSSKSIFKQFLASKQLRRLTKQQIKQFIDGQEIVILITELENVSCFESIAKLYFFIFQLCTLYQKKEVVGNFLTQFRFVDLYNQFLNSQSSRPLKICIVKIAKFLDSFKIGNCAKVQINSLISQYHQFRFIENHCKQPIITETCQLIKDYITQNMKLMLMQSQTENWQNMNEPEFMKFYSQYCELCTICKRIKYIKCSLLNFGLLELPHALRVKIEQKYMRLKKRNKEQYKQNEKQEIQKEQKVTQPEIVPVLNVKKKLKSVAMLISKMQQNL